MRLEISEKIKILKRDIYLLKNNIDWDRSNSELKSLIEISETDGFWDDPKKAQNIMKEIKLKENMINLVNKINKDYIDLKELIELAEIENDSDLINELDNSLDNLIIKSKIGLLCCKECILDGLKKNTLKLELLKKVLVMKLELNQVH